MIVVKDYIGGIVAKLRKQGTLTIASGIATPMPTDSFTIDGEFIDRNLKDLNGNTIADGTYTYVEEKPYYWSGNKNEIERLLSSKDKFDQTRKYPFIVLEQPFTEEPSANLKEVQIDRLRIIIATNTDLNKWNDKRYKDNFKPILYPIFEQFIKELRKSNKVISFDILEKTDVPFYGEDTNTISNDKWDYIDLVLNIRFIENNEC